VTTTPDARPDAQLTHVGLYVNDMAAMVSFYTGLFGIIVTDSGSFNGKELTFLSRRADEHHQLVFVSGREAARDVQVLSQISFRVDGLDPLRRLQRLAVEQGACAMEARNHGNSWSIYFEDPEGNRLEIYTQTPWYVSQPWRVPLDLDRSDDAIVEETRALIDETATWMPVEQWRGEMTARLSEGAG
jgi:catechol-2,3-dioxygenase